MNLKPDTIPSNVISLDETDVCEDTSLITEPVFGSNAFITLNDGRILVGLLLLTPNWDFTVGNSDEIIKYDMVKSARRV